MVYNQRDIVWVNFQFNDGQFKPHLAVIVSDNSLHETTGDYYIVLISSKQIYPENTIEITDEMVNGWSFEKKSYVICHIIESDLSRDFQRKVGTVKKEYFDLILDKVLLTIFNRWTAFYSPIKPMTSKTN